MSYLKGRATPLGNKADYRSSLTAMVVGTDEARHKCLEEWLV